MTKSAVAVGLDVVEDCVCKVGPGHPAYLVQQFDLRHRRLTPPGHINGTLAELSPISRMHRQHPSTSQRPPGQGVHKTGAVPNQPTTLRPNGSITDQQQTLLALVDRRRRVLRAPCGSFWVRLVIAQKPGRTCESQPPSSADGSISGVEFMRVPRET